MTLLPRAAALTRCNKNSANGSNSAARHIHNTYSRAQAIADGNLVDVSEMAREAGIVYPTALTCAVWERYVRVPSHVPGQDEAGRLWDILWMFRCAAKAPRTDREGESIRRFGLFVRNEPDKLESVSLKAFCGPGDLGEPVLTIALPSED